MARPDRIPVRCPQCGTGLRAPLNYAGKRAKCRICGNKVPVPPLPGTPVVVEAEIVEAEELPLEEESAPAPKASRRWNALEEIEDEDEEADDRPRRRGEDDTSRPMWPWIVIGCVLLLAGVSIIGYLIFGGSSYAGKPIAKDDLVGEWVGEADGGEYRYTFDALGTGRISTSGRGNVTLKFFKWNVQTVGGRPHVAIELGGVSERCPASMSDDGKLTLETSFRLTDKLALQSAPITLTRVKSGGDPVIEPKKYDPEKAEAEQLKLLQGRWQPTKVWHDSKGAATESRAVLGGIITIEGKTFRQQRLEEPDEVASIRKIDASPSKPQCEMELTFEAETNLGFHDRAVKVWRCKYSVTEGSFELLRVAPEADFTKQFLPEVLPGQQFVALQPGVRMDVCVRLR